MLTISEVAEIAGVSVATISRVLNDSPLVTDETKKRVRKIIDELDYHPNGVARSLRSARSRMLLAIVPHISNPFYSEIVHGVNEVAHAHNYNLMLCETNTDRSREDAFFSLLKHKSVDAVIALDPAISPDNLKKYGADYPIVQCCEFHEGVQLPYVTIDNEEAAFRAVSHLADTGCRRIALVNADGNFGYARQRQAGFNRALAERQLEPAGEITYRIGKDSGADVARQILDLPVLPDGLFIVSDVVAVGVQRALIDAGIRVPERVSIIGFDDIDLATICTPRLSTVAQPMHAIGRRAAEIIFTALEEGRPAAELAGERHVLDFRLVVRESSR